MSILSNKNVVILDKNLEDFYGLIIGNNIPINKNQATIRTIIDWGNCATVFNFYYDFIENEKLIQQRLIDSAMCKERCELILELGPNRPLVKIDAETFALNWNSFLIESGFGITGITSGGKYFFEFAEDYDKNLYSNFPI